MNFNFIHVLKSALFVTFIWITITSNAQSAYEGIRYQAILRDASGSIVGAKEVYLRLTIYQKGDLGNGYIETHATSTNALGLINLTIGNGIPNQNTFSSVDWGKNTSTPFFIKVEFSDNGGVTFLTFGESQLLSVPYAMYAKNVENADDADADPLNEIQDLSLSGNILEISMNSASTLIDLSPYLDNTDTQLLSFGANDTLQLTNGGKVYLGIYDIETRLKAHIAQYILDQAALKLRLQNLSDSSATNYSTGQSNSFRIQNDSSRLNQAENDLKDTQDSVSVLYTGAFKDSSLTNELQHILINVSNDSLLISDGQGIALNKLFQIQSISIDSLSDAYNDTNLNLIIGSKPNNLVKSGTNSAKNNVGIGNESFRDNTTGSHNVGIGIGALNKNSTGGLNSAIGQEALQSNKVGNGNTAIGRFALHEANADGNTAIGAESSGSNTTGQFNTSVGRFSLKSNKNGSDNSALGSNADVADTNLSYATAIGAGAIVKASNTIQLGSSSIDSVVTSGKLKLGNVIYPNTDGTNGQVLVTDGSGNLSFQDTDTIGVVPYTGAIQAVNLGAFDLTVNSVKIGLGSGNIAGNTALGYEVLSANTTGSNNTASGSYVLEANTTGSYNTASGTNALNKNTIGSDNTASGFNALLQNTTGSYNTASGSYALKSNTTGRLNTASGYLALTSNTTGNENTASGSYALESNTTGSYNTASGTNALFINTTGSDNTASGAYALYKNTTGDNNTASGSYALYLNTTGRSNTAIGYASLENNTTGSYNTASGQSALSSNTTGRHNTASGYLALTSNTTGNDNTASGYFALYSNTTGNNNTASGRNVLYTNTTGSYNTASGSYSLEKNITGNYNTASGIYALNKNTTGSYNTASGSYALFRNTTGKENTASGYEALYRNTTGNYNTASGMFALFNNTTGNNNTASGRSALYSNSTGTQNTASGYATLEKNTTGNSNTAAGTNALNKNTTGSYNTASGVYALNLNTTGAKNTASGYEALSSNTTGFSNTALGTNALNSNTIGSSNTASGEYALKANITGSYNTASGRRALYTSTTGSYNTASGYEALHKNTGSYNTASGIFALFNNTTGNYNTSFGSYALEKNTTGTHNTAIGYGADLTAGALNNTIAIGYNAKVSSSNTIQLGNSSIDSVVTSGKLKLGNVIYPNTDGTIGQVLATDGAGNANWIAPMPNVTRSIVIAPGMFPTEAFTGSTTIKKMLGGWQIPVIEMADGKTGQIAMSIPIPSDWVSGTAVKVKLLYSSNTNSGSIYFKFGSAQLAENATTVTATTSSNVSLNVSATAYGLKEYSYTISVNAATKVLHIYLRRQGTNAADTNTGFNYIHGVNLEYTSK